MSSQLLCVKASFFFALLLEDQDDFFFFMLKIQNYVPLAVNLSIWKQEVYITGTSTTEW